MADAAKDGDKVKVHYTGKLDDGTVFDSSKGCEPLEFTIGKHNVIAGFEKAVDGMTVGQAKSVRIPKADAYGERDETLTIKVERSKFPPNIEPEVGLHLQMTQPGGRILNVLVAEVTEERIVLDANHPFAGKDLNFEIELVEIGGA